MKHSVHANGAREGVKEFAAADFAQWQHIMRNRFVPLQMSRADPEAPFTGQVRGREFGDIHVSLISADEHSVRRLPEQIRVDEPRFVKLSLQLSGRSFYAQDGRSTEVGAGDLVIYDTSRPYAVDMLGRVDALIVIIPPTVLTLSRENSDVLTARRLSSSSSVGEVAHPFLTKFARQFEAFSLEDGSRLLRAFMGLVDAMLHHELATLVENTSDFDRIRNYIEQHLGDPELSAVQVAQQNFISLRSLQYLFHDKGTTVSEYIRGERLNRCYLDLASPAFSRETIGQIASRHGFVVPAHFSRLFKQHFGATPLAFRRRASLDASDAPERAPQAGAGSMSP